MHQFDLKNRTAIITGGAQGFGFDIAKKFLNSGANVIIWDIDENELQNTLKKINSSKLSYNVVDVSNFEKINEIVLEIKTNPEKHLSVEFDIKSIFQFQETAIDAVVKLIDRERNSKKTQEQKQAS